MGSTYKQWADAADAASKKAESSGSGEDHIRASELHRRALNEAAQSGDLTPAQREKAVSKHSNTFSKHAQKAGKVLENSEYMKLASKHAGDIDHRSHAPAVESEDAPKGLGRLAAARGKGERTPAMFDEEKMSGAKARAESMSKEDRSAVARKAAAARWG